MHLRSILLLLFIFIFCRPSYSQNSQYDKVFAETAQVLLSSNPKKALSNTDYLYKIAQNNNERIKAGMLKATLLRQYGLRNEAIAALKKADSIASSDQNYTQMARINGFLSTLHRENEIYSLGKIYLNKAVQASRNIENKAEMYKFQGNLSQEIAYYEMNSFNYSKAIEKLKDGNILFKKAGPEIDVNFNTAVNDELIAKNYLSLNKADSALFYYAKATKELQESQSSESPLKGFILNGLGNVYREKGDPNKALQNYNKAEQIANQSNFFILKQEVYNAMMAFYKNSDSRKYIAYNELNLKLHKDEEESRKMIADDLIKTLRKNHINSQSQYKKSTVVMASVFSSAVLLTIVFFSYRRRQDFKNFNSIISKATFKKDSSQRRDNGKEYMSEATENSILNSLKESEKAQFYLNSEVSLTTLAAELGINHRYLSYVINKNTEKDFAGYINELRINYIVDRLRNNPSYLKYKISYLADLSGFSSHSRFTTTFKKVTGQSPVDFIRQLENENNS
ncbi:helix-turn-helix domain-containing protein [uncultured Flavobacterium sp.]|uniref:helix-turn-helix domain-containing protein n=1 Tax=uncultured Flavobacterium sp. TaxID=165435 RepID=UPI0025CCFFDB|nr:helix-turn-helix domain-containing protein [uncultured Flavobacterium sp.]